MMINMRLFTKLLSKLPQYKKQQKTLNWYKTYTHNLYENWKLQCEKNRELESRLKNDRKNERNNKRTK